MCSAVVCTAPLCCLLSVTMSNNMTWPQQKINVNISMSLCLVVSPRTSRCRQREMGGFYFRAAGWYKQEKHCRLGEQPCHIISSTPVRSVDFFDFWDICGCLLKVNTHHIQSASDDEVDFKDSGFHQDSSLQQVRTPYTWRGTVVFIHT